MVSNKSFLVHDVFDPPRFWANRFGCRLRDVFDESQYIYKNDKRVLARAAISKHVGIQFSYNFFLFLNFLL